MWCVVKSSQDIRIFKKNHYVEITLLHLLGWLKIKILTVPNAGEEVGELEILDIAGRNVRWYHHFGK